MTEAAADIAKTARRMPEREASLVWSLTGGAIAVASYFLTATRPWMPNPFGMSSFGNGLVFGLVLGGALALLWYLAVHGKIQAAREAHAGHLHDAEAARQAETAAKIAAMKSEAAHG